MMEGMACAWVLACLELAVATRIVSSLFYSLCPVCCLFPTFLLLDWFFAVWCCTSLVKRRGCEIWSVRLSTD